MSVSGGETGALGVNLKLNKNNYIVKKMYNIRFQFRFYFDRMRWAAGVRFRVQAGVMALVSRWNGNVLGYKGLLSALKWIEFFVSDIWMKTSDM
jgi:hypothetical protein